MLLVVIIVILAYLVEYLAGQWQRWCRARGNAQWRRLARIDVPEAEHISPDGRVLRQLDLPAERVLDVCVIRGPLSWRDIGPKATDMLKKLYADGQAIGLDTRELAFSRRDLAEGEGLYLVSLDARPNLRFVALLGRFTAPPLTPVPGTRCR
ncbi:hypothetical protein [Paludibacterium yongneupense]|uniref:hypothetical protein n=1 Tax=Paludibacterium yongneupense TaxID=400061 RepID=UPI00041AC8D6|nr:hypothetical protein [Paludibacterium yongneupense]